MELIQWSGVYAVDIPEIDRQHQELVKIINRLFQFMSEQKGKEILQPTLDELSDYIIYHFSTEEALMKEKSYPLMAEHKAEHALFIEKVIKFRKEFDTLKTNMSIEIFYFLKDWLYHHITEVDKNMAKYINQLK